MTTTKKAGGATFVGFTYEEFNKYMGRAFRALRPKPVDRGGEISYVLTITDRFVVIVQSSIHKGYDTAAQSGTDPIRVGWGYLDQGGKFRPLVAKFEIVKRTENWRDNLEDRVNDFVSEYYAHKIQYDARLLPQGGSCTSSV